MKNTTSKQTNGNPSKESPDTSEGLRELFVNALKDIYSAEQTLVKAIPKMIDNATSKELIDALRDHLKVTQGQVTRLEDVFASIGKRAEPEKCEAILGLVKEAEEIMKDNEKGVVRDAGIILAAQKVEHYEIATYGTLCAFADALGEEDAASLLEKTLDEEKEADEKLSDIATTTINVEAAQENNYVTRDNR